MDKDNIMIIEFIRNWHSFKEDMVAIYNKKSLTEEQVRDVINSDMYSDKVVFVTRAQYDSVFKGFVN